MSSFNEIEFCLILFQECLFDFVRAKSALMISTLIGVCYFIEFFLCKIDEWTSSRNFSFHLWQAYRVSIQGMFWS